MQIGERVRVERLRGERLVVEHGVVTRADAWNGIWVGTRDTVGAQWHELPLGDFVEDGRITEEPRPEPRAGEPLAALAVLLAAGAFAAVLAWRAILPRAV